MGFKVKSGLKAKIKEFMLERAVKGMVSLASTGDADKNVGRFIKIAEKITSDPLWVDAIQGFKYRWEINHPLMEIPRRIMNEFNPNVRHRLVRNLVVKEALVGADKRHIIEKELGFYPPTLMVISPIMNCNISCEGCYAAKYSKLHQLEYDVVDDVLTQAKDIGIHFVVVTGGEPLFYDGMMDLIEKHDDIAFQMYTNGTLIDKKMAKRIAKAGNLIPCPSLEGLKDETNMRRGEGVFEKVDEAFVYLRAEGCCFGFSATATRYNIDSITSPEFLDYVERKGVTLGWYFSYIPIGKDPDLRLMPTPLQRYTMGARIRRIRETRTFFAADFWNDGPHVDGCISSGKRYFHINVNGDVEPCVFAQFTVDNIKDKPLVECLDSRFFQELRSLQPFDKDLRRPCMIIDRPEILRDVVNKTGARPSYPENLKLITELADGLDSYAAELSDHIDEYSAIYDADPYRDFGKVSQRGWQKPIGGAVEDAPVDATLNI
jgi:MoaA/NifB/PqqE/SkfB family radical SAM enzyme